MKKKDLFECFDLFDVRDFGKVIPSSMFLRMKMFFNNSHISSLLVFSVLLDYLPNLSNWKFKSYKSSHKSSYKSSQHFPDITPDFYQWLNREMSLSERISCPFNNQQFILQYFSIFMRFQLKTIGHIVLKEVCYSLQNSYFTLCCQNSLDKVGFISSQYIT